MLSHRNRVSIPAAVLALALGACATPVAVPTEPPAPTADQAAIDQAVSETAEAAVAATMTALAPTETPEATATEAPTQTAEPTATPEATATPVPAATPEFVRWQASDVTAAFQAAGLVAESPRPMTKDDYGPAPMRAQEAIRFLVPSLGEGNGGRIFSCATPDDLAAMEGYYVEMGKASAWFFSWTFTRDNVLVQINGDLPEGTAKQYEAALAAMQ